MSKLITIDSEYAKWIEDIAQRYEQRRTIATTLANEQLLRFYWSVGEDIARKKAVSKWGDVVIATMSRELSGPLESLRESSRDRASDYKSMKQYIDITESAKGHKIFLRN